MSTIVIIGAGFTGLCAAYDLCRAGHKVTVLEQDATPGGLAGTFEILPGISIEKFYHHWFTSDVAVLNLCKEIGLEDKLRFLKSNTGLYYANNRFRLNSPIDLLSFKPIPLIDRIRTGLMALYARRINNWKALEAISAEEWLISIGGRKAYEVIWKPLLRGKFGAEASEVSAVWIWNKLKLRGSSRGKSGNEELVYCQGGFRTVINALCDKILSLGGTIEYNSGVTRIAAIDNKISHVETNNQKYAASNVLVTVPIPTFLNVAPALPTEYRTQLSSIRFLGNVCIVMCLKKSLSETYWLNVADPSFPFVGVIEHTNFDSPQNFAGKHIAYLSKYLPTSDFLYGASDREVQDYCLPYIQKIFPEFTAEWIEKFFVWRAQYSQPVVTKHYSTLVPPIKTPVDGLWLCSMAQIYPQDRGTNYAVQYGRDCAKQMIAAL